MAEIWVSKSVDGALRPLYDTGYEYAKKMKVGEAYKVTIKKPRNGGFHRKYFALLNLTLQNFPEEYNEAYPTLDNLLDEVKLQLGHYELRQTLGGKPFYKLKSISFASMDQDAFEDFYSKTLDILIKWFLKGGDRKTIEEEIIHFM